MSTAQQINVFNLRYRNLTPTATMYANATHNIQTGMAKPRKTQYKSVNQLLKECPLVGTTKLGLNFIA